MSGIIHYVECPVCGSKNFHEVLRVKDRTVSQEMFPVMECADCTLRFTQDVPAEDHIGPYYKSENYISHTATKKGLINNLYHAVRKRTIQRKRQLITKLTGVTAGALMDIGAGTGTFAAEMKAHGWQVTGLEPDDTARKVAYDMHGVQLLPPDELEKAAPGSFDAITMWHVLEHVHALQHYMQRLKVLLKPGGKLFIAVPNYTSADAVKYGKDWAAYDVPRHLYHFSPKSMQALLERNGLKLEQQLPMVYDSFYISLLSSGYRHGKTSWVEAVTTGLRSNLTAMSDRSRYSSIIYVIGK